MTADDVVMPKTAAQWSMLVALKVEEDYGAGGHVCIAEMLGRFAVEGDESGIDTWKAIARAYDQLMRAPRGLN